MYFKYVFLLGALRQSVCIAEPNWLVFSTVATAFVVDSRNGGGDDWANSTAAAGGMKILKTLPWVCIFPFLETSMP